nr:sodium:proton antiporter [Chitinophagaceae bacterium]
MTWLLLAVFFIGYIFIIIEHNVKIDKAASALITGVLCWVVYSFSTTDQHLVNHELLEHISEIAGIVFFLIGAMTIVELIDLYDGFQIIIDKITTNNKRKLLYIVTL